MSEAPFRLTVVNLSTVFIARVLPWLVVCAVLWLFRESAVTLSQDSPNVHPFLQVLASANRARSFAFLLGILGLVYGFAQRELRRRSAAEFSQRLKALQEHL
jgi:hypothetical protein